MPKLLYEDLELDFERVFGVMEWSQYGIADHKGECWLVVGTLNDEVVRTYICQSKEEIKKCIRIWPCQDSYCIYEMETILEAHLLANDFRYQCGYKESISQQL